MSPDLIAGRYQVLRPVGRGGMGTVWLCRDEVLGREVAVKQIGALPGESAPDAARALREARSSAALNHRNVVSVFDIVDADDGNAWLVMEYVPSRTLGELVREEGPLPPHRAGAIGAQVADGLAAAHALGTIHRDVKPGNILVGKGDLAKISDFGIARGADDEQLTRTGLVTGTPGYFSPELARGEDPGPQSDVYALGATLYFAVEGHAPYPGQRNPIALLQKIASEEPPAAVHAGPLAGPIERMMDRDAASRWSMADAAHTLRRLTENPDAGVGNTAVLAAPFAERGDEATRSTPRPVGRGDGAAALGADDAMAAAVAASAANGGGGPGGGPTGSPAGDPGQPAEPGVPEAGPPSDAGPPAPPGGVATDREPARSGSARRVTPWLLGAAVLLLALLGGGYMLISGDPTKQPPKAAPQSPSPTAERSPSPRQTSTPSPSATSSPQQKAASVSPGRAMERSVQSYFALMPGSTDAGWKRLAPSMQAMGRDSYDNFWSSVRSVDLQSTQAIPARHAVDIELTYYMKDGSAKQETHRLTMQRSGTRYLIAHDELLSSRTAS